jgi:hypothetical protein
MAITIPSAAKIRAELGAVTRDYEAGGTVNVGKPVYLDSAGKVQEARANAAATSFAIGVVVQTKPSGVASQTSAAAGERVTVCVLGPVHGYLGLPEGAPVYLDSAAVGFSDAALSGSGKWNHVIGYAESDVTLYVNPTMSAPNSLS